MLPLTAGRISAGSYDKNLSAAETDRLNREVTEESLDALNPAMTQEYFSYSGRHLFLTPPGIYDHGEENVVELSLVPPPVHPFETWEAVTSPPPLAAVATRGLSGVFWLKEKHRLAAGWKALAETYRDAHGRELARGEKRILALNVAVGDTDVQAMAQVRDEFRCILAPSGWGCGYNGLDRSPARDFVPILEDSIAQGPWAVGTGADVAERIAELDESVGLSDLVIFPAMPGDPFPRVHEQPARFAEEVLPMLPPSDGASP